MLVRSVISFMRVLMMLGIRESGEVKGGGGGCGYGDELWRTRWFLFSQTISWCELMNLKALNTARTAKNCKEDIHRLKMLAM
jgi:hypothetical protein